MTSHDQIFSADQFTASKPARSLLRYIRSIGRRLVIWADTCADHCAAAAMYEQRG
jgi:hypothetical protein